jgi:predicted phosphodiesterase
MRINIFPHSVLPCLFFILALGCKQESKFKHDITSGSLPWTHDKFDVADEKFTFAIFTDLTGGEREGIFKVAVEQLNLLRPEMIINVGDLIDGEYENLDELKGQWDSFDQRADRARAPIFYVGGNHDLTKEEMWHVWDERYGERYYHFIYKNVLFLVLNSEDNSLERMQEIYDARARALERIKAEGMEIMEQTEYFNLPEQTAGNIGPEQSSYFQNVINENPNVLHTFLFMHKAPWRKEGEKNFAAIEAALSERPYTVFNGHVHAYEYEKRYGRDYIRLATTGGVQFPDRGRSADHVTLVTVDNEGVNIANLLMAGILDKTGHIPIGGDSLCFEQALCNHDY